MFCVIPTPLNFNRAVCVTEDTAGLDEVSVDQVGLPLNLAS